VELSTRGCELAAWKEANYLDTLAAGLAECGRFAEAVERQKQAAAAAPREHAAEFRQRVQLYQAGKPYRLP
jgi:hypothetical protein